MSQKNFMSYGDAETLFSEIGNKVNDTFVGTQAQWNALTTEQKKAYRFADITDDHDDNPVGNLSALTTTDKSSAVAGINEVNKLVNNIFNPDYSTVLDNSDDLNALLQVGIYFYYGYTTPANIPNAQALNGIVAVTHHANVDQFSRYSQILYSYNLNSFFYRNTMDDGVTWSNWKVVDGANTLGTVVELTVNGSNIPAPSDGYVMMYIPDANAVGGIFVEDIGMVNLVGSSDSSINGSVFVKKGMNIKVGSNGANTKAYFYPFV